MNTSHYPSQHIFQSAETHTLSVIVDNEPGVLARVVGLFSGRGYNIESLTVSETEHEAHLSRITIVTTGTPMVIEQIKNQLDRLVPVHRVVDLTVNGRVLARELALIKVRAEGAARLEVAQLAEIFRAKIIDVGLESVIVEVSGDTEKIDRLIDVLRPKGALEIMRTGCVAMRRNWQPEVEARADAG